MTDDAIYTPRAERVSFDMPVRARHDGLRTTIWLKNLTCGGARVEGIGGLRAGDELTLFVPTLKPKTARVAWVVGHAIGLEFDRPLHPDVFEGLVLHYGRQRPRTEADRALQIDPRPIPPVEYALRAA